MMSSDRKDSGQDFRDRHHSAVAIARVHLIIIVMATSHGRTISRGSRGHTDPNMVGRMVRTRDTSPVSRVAISLVHREVTSPVSKVDTSPVSREATSPANPVSNITASMVATIPTSISRTRDRAGSHTRRSSVQRIMIRMQSTA